ncbi:DNA-formamidopyrimidine glycosylase [Paenibacillus sambharensis]|uniref:Formamidopyrimidine-DNA glycosylase n=1 Tax=Paenibacillus sambharensis TaxID=1803190 RepID=A0A2W1L3V8_9BACL|nr:DNA-formamidopyrimidine glycosylase [Paenibacillus sambharensis]PZD93663.1 DNA-formamidopyrimidine glycosylase [Paenibacillus sambharensis]
MPEWPEMETYRRLLSEKIAGARITGVEVTRSKSINVDEQQFAAGTVGSTVLFVEQRGKHLVFHLDNGNRLLLHLMLGGLLYWGAHEEDKPDRSVQVAVHFAAGTLHFIGLRLGYLHLLTAKETNKKLAELGPEPFDKRMDEQLFRARFAKKKGKLKTALVDQSVIAGIGNCYADEMAFKAGIRPDRAIPGLTDEEWTKLYSAMKEVLYHAARLGGYMEMPLFKGDTLTGGYNENCLVYDREGEPCRECGTPIVKEELSSRKVFYCPNCQQEG